MANKELMITLGLDASSYTQNVKKAKETNKELDSGFKLLASSSEKFEDSLNGLGKKQEFLANKMKLANNLTEVYSKRIDETRKNIVQAQKSQVDFTNALEKALKAKEAIGKKTKENAADYNSASKSVKSYQQQLDKATKAIELNKRRLTEARTGYNETQKSLQQLARESVIAGEKMAAMSRDAKVDRLTNDIKQLDHNFEIAKHSIKNFDNSMEGLQKTQEHYNARTKLTSTLLKNYSKDIEISSKAVEVHKVDLKEVGVELDKWQKKLAKMDGTEANYKQIKASVEQLRGEYSQINGVVEFHNERIKRLGNEYRATEVDMARMRGTLDRTTQKMKELAKSVTFEATHKEIQKLTNNSLAKLEQKLSKVDKEFDLLKASVVSYSNSITGLNAKQNHINNSLKITEQLFSEYSQELIKTKSKVSTLTNAQDKLAIKIQKQITLLNSLEGEGAAWDKQKVKVESLKKKYEENNKALELHRNKLKEVSTGYDKSAKSMAKLETELKSAKKHLADFGRQQKFDKLDNDIKTTTNRIKLLDSQFRVTETAVENFGRSKRDLAQKTEYYNTKLILLQNQMRNYKTSIKTTEAELSKMKIQQDKTSASIEKLKNELKGVGSGTKRFATLTTELINLETEFNENRVAIERYEASLTGLRVDLNQTAASTNILSASQRTLSASFTAARFDRIGTAFTTVGNGIRSVGQSMMGLSMLSTLAGGAMIKTGVDFERGMANVKAVMQPTEEQFKQLTETARHFGSTTVFTSSEAADGLKYLGMVGFDTTQSIDALPKVLNLAQASSLELGTAADLATDAIASLGYTGEDAVKELPSFLDKVAKASTKSNLTIEEMLRTFIRVGGSIDNMKIPIDQVSGALGVMANRGLKGTKAGTSLNSVLINLTKDGGESAKAMEELGLSMFDQQGNLKDFESSMQEISKGLTSLTDEKKIKLENMLGGKVQVEALRKMLNGMFDDAGNLTEEYKNLKKEIETAPDENFLEKMAFDMTDNLYGDLKRMTSALQGMFEDIFEAIGPQLREMVQGITKNITELADKFTSLSPSMQMALVKFGAFLMIGPPIMMILGGFVSGTGAVIKAILGTGGAVTKLGGFLRSTQGKISTFGSALAKKSAAMKASGAAATATGGKMAALGGKVTSAGGSVVGITGKFATFVGGLSAASLAIAGAVAAFVGIAAAIGSNSDALNWLIDEWGVFGTAIAMVCEFIYGVCQLVFGNIGHLLKGLAKTIQAFFTGQWGKMDDIWRDTWSDMNNTTAQAMGNITMSTTKGINAIKKATKQELGDVTKSLEYFQGSLAKVTADTVPSFAKTYAECFEKVSTKTIDMLQGTSETMVLLFDGIKEGMSKSDMTKQFEDNLKHMNSSGKLSASDLERDFKKAFEMISKNSKDGMLNVQKTTNKITDELANVSAKGLYNVSENISNILGKMDKETLSSIKNMGGTWAKLFEGIKLDGSESTEKLREIVIANYNSLAKEGIDILAVLKGETKKAFEDTNKVVDEQLTATVGNANKILETLKIDTTNNFRDTADGVVEVLKGMDAETIKQLISTSDNWYALLHGSLDDNGQLTENFAHTVHGNFNFLKIKTKEEMEAFVAKLSEDLNQATIVVSDNATAMKAVADGVGKEIADNLTPETTLQQVAEATGRLPEQVNTLVKDIIANSEGTGKEIADNLTPETTIQQLSDATGIAPEQLAGLVATLKGVSAGTGEEVADNLTPKDAKAQTEEAVAGAEGVVAGAATGMETASEGVGEKVAENIAPKTLAEQTQTALAETQTAITEQTSAIATASANAGQEGRTAFQTEISKIADTIKIDGNLIDVATLNAQMTGAGTSAITSFATGWHSQVGLLTSSLATELPSMSATLSDPINLLSSAFGALSGNIAIAYDNATSLDGKITNVGNMTLTALQQNTVNVSTNLKDSLTATNNLKKALSDLTGANFNALNSSAGDTIKKLESIKSSSGHAKTAINSVGKLKLGTLNTDLDSTKKKLDTVKTSGTEACKPVDKLTKFSLSNLKIGIDSIITALTNLKTHAESAKTSISNINNVSVTPVVNKINSIKTALDKVASAARSSASAIANVKSPSTFSIFGSRGYNIQNTQDVTHLQETVNNISIPKSGLRLSDYSTSGGFYSPTSFSGSNKETSQNNNNNNRELVEELRNQNTLLMKILTSGSTIDVALNVDGRQMAKASAKYMENEIKNINGRKNRLGGR